MLEAARSGVPALASSNGGADEIIEHGKTGFIFNPRNISEGYHYLNTLVNEASMRKQISKNAKRSFIENFKVERMVDEYKFFWQEEMNSN